MEVHEELITKMYTIPGSNFSWQSYGYWPWAKWGDLKPHHYIGKPLKF